MPTFYVEPHTVPVTQAAEGDEIICLEGLTSMDIGAQCGNNDTR